MIEEMLAYNREFVRSKGYEKFQTIVPLVFFGKPCYTDGRI